MQRCLDFASKAQKNSLVRVIANNTLDLVEDQYGNYVVNTIAAFSGFRIVIVGPIHSRFERERS
jgi:hypothetical protein